MSSRSWIWRLPWLLVRLVVQAWHAVFFILERSFHAALFGVDLVHARKALRGGNLHCPNGHRIATEGGTYACAGCGFVYGGPAASIWVCGNPECHATTPYVNCGECGLSARNPYRYGRPE